ncbi:hypothetical protein [Streptomyces sp. NPDC013455]|uniref:hypothetical protein n=1 Tax=Streptomyces sp. NPDC013455 TaxID=3155605 RepID=UPI003400BDFA
MTALPEATAEPEAPDAPPAPAMIPGVVDGTVTTSTDAEGNVSFHIAVGDTPGGAYVEFILTGEHAGRLGSALLGATGRPDVLVPCSVGIRPASGHGAR